jgi:hypothetical protein
MAQLLQFESPSLRHADINAIQSVCMYNSPPQPRQTWRRARQDVRLAPSKPSDTRSMIDTFGRITLVREIGFQDRGFGLHLFDLSGQLPVQFGGSDPKSAELDALLVKLLSTF